MGKKIKIKYYNIKDKENAKKMEEVLNWYAEQPEFKKSIAQEIYVKLIEKELFP